MNRPIGLPVEGDIRITSAAGKQRGTYVHRGTDFGAQTPGVAGDPLVAVTDGVLAHQYTSPTFGKTSVLERDNGDGTYSYFVYAHQSRYDPKMELTPEHPTRPVSKGRVIGYMGNTGSSAVKKSIPVHEHLEQIDTSGKLDFSRGWPFSSGAATGITPSGVTWQKVGPSFELPNGWIAKSDAGRVTVTVPSGFEKPLDRGDVPSPGEAAGPQMLGISRRGTQADPSNGAIGAGDTVPSFGDRWNALGRTNPQASPARTIPPSSGYSLPAAPQLLFDPNALRAVPQSFRGSAAAAPSVAAQLIASFMLRHGLAGSGPSPQLSIMPGSPRSAAAEFRAQSAVMPTLQSSAGRPGPLMGPPITGNKPLDQGPGRALPFADRFGHWTETAAGTMPVAQPSGALGAVAPGSAKAVAPEDTRRLTRVNASNAANAFGAGSAPVPYLTSADFNDRFGNWVIPPADQQSSQASRPIGALADEPSYLIPPPIWGLDERSTESKDAEEWFSRWVRPFLRQD